MAFTRRVRTSSGATAVQAAEYRDGRQRILKHFGSAHSEVDLGVLIEVAVQWLDDPAQGRFDLAVAKQPVVKALVAGPAERELLPAPPAPTRTTSAARVRSTASRLLFDPLASVYDDLGFGVVRDDVFRDLVVARIVKPTSLFDSGRVLGDLGQHRAGYATMKRTLARAADGRYRELIARACLSHVLDHGDLTLVLYDVTTLYFEAEREDDLRKVGYSKERRVDPQVVVADAGMLSGKNLGELDQAGLRFIVGSRATKAPIDLASHFRWQANAFSDGQIIDTVTPRTTRSKPENDEMVKAEPLWGREEHPSSWRAVWAYSHKRAVRDRRTLAKQEERARAVVAGERKARIPRFVKNVAGTKVLDEASLERAKFLVALLGYVTNMSAETMSAEAVISSYHGLWHVEQSFRMSKTDLAARPMFVRSKHAIEAHLTIVFSALALSREVQNRTGLSIRRVCRQLRPLRAATIAINGAMQTLDPEIPPDQLAILDASRPPESRALTK